MRGIRQQTWWEMKGHERAKGAGKHNGVGDVCAKTCGFSDGFTDDNVRHDRKVNTS